MRVWLVAVSVFAVGALGCTDVEPNPIGGGVGGVDGDPQAAPMRRILSGDVTWSVSFDATAVAQGATSCTYTRHYEGVEDSSAPWLCPSCEVMFRANVAMTDGLNSCFAQISMNPPSETEWLGYANGVWWRGGGGPMTEQGTVAIDGGTLHTANSVADLEAPNGGFFGFDIVGVLSEGEEPGDALHGFEVPETYACGWPKADPPPYTGEYIVQVGNLVPDGVFKDHCEEAVRVHDFAGSYLLIDMSAVDCPPCNAMASGESVFVANMAAQGIEVHVMTMLAPSLQDPLGETTTQMLSNWIATHNLHSPVLADRGWGLTMFLPAIGDETGYPSWMLVDPTLRVVDFGTGFSDYLAFQNAIVAHAAANQ